MKSLILAAVAALLLCYLFDGIDNPDPRCRSPEWGNVDGYR